MKEKVGLNNVQRKMLDEIYTEQFDKIAGGILSLRTQEYEKLKLTVLRDERKKEPVKSILEHLESAEKLVEKHKNYFDDNGLRFDNTIHKNDVTISRYDSILHPKLKAYSDKTREIEIDLAKKRKEIRARVYGLNTTYAEVEKEVSAFIADLKQ